LKLYFAGAESDLENLNKCNVKNLLISVANGKNKIKKVNEIFKDYKLIMDSGAFSFYRKNKEMTSESWLLFIDEIKNYCTEIISLDVIGNAEKTLSNYIEISKSLKVIPTFHVGSDIKYFKKYLELTDRICIGGMVTLGSNTSILLKYLDEIFSCLDYTKQLPKLHAFGIFNQKILEKYPFYSSDSSTWNAYVKFGEIEYFDEIKGKYRLKNFKKLLGLEGFSIQEVIGNRQETKLEQLNFTIQSILKMEKYITDLWDERGITWID
jgi:hypothetical protein